MRKIEIEWRGETFFISEDRWFELAEEVEEIITLVDIHEITIRPRLTKIARAYSVMINFAGGESTPSDVHRDMLAQLGDAAKPGGQTRKIIASNAIMVLAQVILGDSGAADDDTEKKGQRRPKAKAKAKTRKREGHS